MSREITLIFCVVLGSVEFFLLFAVKMIEGDNSII